MDEHRRLLKEAGEREQRVLGVGKERQEELRQKGMLERKKLVFAV